MRSRIPSSKQSPRKTLLAIAAVGIGLSTLSACGSMARERISQRLDDRLQFEQIDTDRNGCISPSELDRFKQTLVQR